MPRYVSPEIMAVKNGKGIKHDLIHIATDTPFFFTDCAWDVDYSGNTYQKGALLGVDPGAMTAGITANDWGFDLSAEDDGIFGAILSQNLNLRWVYHYRAYFSDSKSGFTLVGVEPKKFGLILLPEDMTSPEKNTVSITVTSPFGDVEKTNHMATNNASQHRRFGTDDNFFQFTQETTLTIPKSNSRGSGIVRGGYGGGRGSDGSKYLQLR